MKKERKDNSFIKKPIYKGGPSALKEFIANHIKYPKEALDKKIEGTVFVRYAINHQGKVIDAKIISTLGYGCDEEAIRLVKLLKFNVPKNRGIKVLFHKNIQIHFHLPKTNLSPNAKTSVQYNYTPKATGKKENPIQKKNSYSYTINIAK